jgi:hypothetical protein
VVRLSQQGPQCPRGTLGIFAASAAATVGFAFQGERLRSIRRSACRLMLGAPIGAAWSRLDDNPDGRLLFAYQPGPGTAPVRTSSAATSRSLVLVCWEAWVRMVNASSSLILCRSIKMPFACSMQARDIIAVCS